MMMDKTGHLWISTNKRIIEYDPKTGGQINYQAGQDIVVNSFTKHSCFESQAGEMFYGGNRGIALSSWNVAPVLPDITMVMVTWLKNVRWKQLLKKEIKNC